MNIFILVIYWSATVLTIFRLIPQLYTTFRTRSVKNISLKSLFFNLFACLSWVVYAVIFIKTLGFGILIVNVMASFIAILLIILILYTNYKNKKNNDTSEDKRGLKNG